MKQKMGCLREVTTRRKGWKRVDDKIMDVITVWVGDVEIEVDARAILDRYAQRALRSKGRRANLLGGAVVLRATNVQQGETVSERP